MPQNFKEKNLDIYIVRVACRKGGEKKNKTNLSCQQKGNCCSLHLRRKLVEGGKGKDVFPAKLTSHS